MHTTYNDLRSKEMEIRMTFRSVYTLKEALAGKTFMPEIMSLTLQLEEFMLRRYEIRNNKMSGEVEYRDKSLLRFTFSLSPAKSATPSVRKRTKKG